MEDKDIMVGDWVMVDKSPQMIVKIMGNYIDTKEHKQATIKDLSPIPLTSKMLIDDNGFISLNDVGICILDHEQVRIEAAHCYIGIYNKSMRKRVLDLHSTQFNVHELQHALRLFGLNELADNFNVTKDSY